MKSFRQDSSFFLPFIVATLTSWTIGTWSGDNKQSSGGKKFGSVVKNLFRIEQKKICVKLDLRGVKELVLKFQLHTVEIQCKWKCKIFFVGNFHGNLDNFIRSILFVWRMCAAASHEHINIYQLSHIYPLSSLFAEFSANRAPQFTRLHLTVIIIEKLFPVYHWMHFVFAYTRMYKICGFECESIFFLAFWRWFTAQ